jgi:phenylacetate-CoA ligase
MSEFFDRYENRPAKSRELALFRELKGIVSVARARAPALRKQMIGVDIKEIKKRADLARIPVLRRRDLMELQSEQPPLGGFAATRLGALKRVHVSPGPFFQPEGQARDWWGAARALFAAGARKGDVVLNCLPYHLRPDGHMMDSGAQALGCAVIPAGDAHIGETLDAIRQVQPQFVCGHADFLDQLMFNARRSKTPVDCLKRALVIADSLSEERRRHFAQNGMAVRLAYVVPEAGVVAYETETSSGVVADGMIVNEGLILEIVASDSGAPLGAGKIGEIVITRLNADYPLLRFGTGDLSELLTGPSPCGRTNLRIRGVMGKVGKPKNGAAVLAPPRK